MKTKKLSPIAALVCLVLTLAIAPLAQAAPAHSRHSVAHGKARTTASRSGRASSKSRPARASAAHGKVKSAKALKTLTASGPRARGRVRPAMRASRRGHARTPSPELQAVRLAMPPPLRGSHESLVHQNEMAEADGLERILDDSDLEDRIAHGSLVPVPVSAGLHVNPELPENRRYCRPWTARFLSDLAQAHSSRFAGSPIEVTSAVRTVEYQRHLRHINGNAAAADGDIASPHLTGGTIDLGKQGMTAREIGWLRAWLIPLEQAGKIDVEEEFKQSCFHISVYKSYTDPKAAPHLPSGLSPASSAAILGIHGR